MLDQLRGRTEPDVLHIAEYVWQRKDMLIEWPRKSLCFLDGCVRIKYHAYSPEQKQALREARIAADSRSNGPAIMSFLLAGGKRPAREVRGKSWSVHHIYDGKCPAPDGPPPHTPSRLLPSSPKLPALSLCIPWRTPSRTKSRSSHGCCGRKPRTDSDSTPTACSGMRGGTWDAFKEPRNCRANPLLLPDAVSARVNPQGIQVVTVKSSECEG